MDRLKTLFRACADALIRPTDKQKEAYGRLLHTMCAASSVGSVTVAWTLSGWTLENVARVAGLALLALVLFFLGAILSKGGK